MTNDQFIEYRAKRAEINFLLKKMFPKSKTLGITKPMMKELNDLGINSDIHRGKKIISLFIDGKLEKELIYADVNTHKLAQYDCNIMMLTIGIERKESCVFIETEPEI